MASLRFFFSFFFCPPPRKQNAGEKSKKEIESLLSGGGPNGSNDCYIEDERRRWRAPRRAGLGRGMLGAVTCAGPAEQHGYSMVFLLIHRG